MNTDWVTLSTDKIKLRIHSSYNILNKAIVITQIATTIFGGKIIFISMYIIYIYIFI